MKSYPFFEKRKQYDLNVLWDFSFIEDVEYENIDPANINYDDRLVVPSTFDAFPAYAGKRGMGIYRCFVDISPNTEAVLKIGGAGMLCKVFIDGNMCVSHIGSYTPFEIYILPSEETKREIVVVTDNRYDYERCPLHENFFDFYNYGGIIRQVWLEELPADPIARAHIITEDIKTGKIKVKVKFYDSPVPVSYSIDNSELQIAESVILDSHTVEFIAFVPNPTQWSVEEPNLHLITIDTGEDSITTRFGIRQVCTEKGKIFLNGKPLKLLGYCRHEAHPQFGPATPEALMISDLQLLKNMGCNFIRGAHYQQDSRFLDLCDEFGFVVFSESLGWGQDGGRFEDKHFVDALSKQTSAMVVEDFNHPSIIIWGFLNEGGSDQENAGKCYSDQINLIRSLDATRLVTYASNRCLNDLFLEDVDVVSFNFYPGWYPADRNEECPLHEVVPKINEMLLELEKRGVGDKPFLISEIGAGAIYGWHDQHNGYWTEEYQAELLRLVCDETISNDKIAGLALWQFCDIRTYQGGQALLRPRAFNNKGTFDEYRRPKAAYKTVKKIFKAFGEKN